MGQKAQLVVSPARLKRGEQLASRAFNTTGKFKISDLSAKACCNPQIRNWLLAVQPSLHPLVGKLRCTAPFASVAWARRLSFPLRW